MVKPQIAMKQNTAGRFLILFLIVKHLVSAYYIEIKPSDSFRIRNGHCFDGIEGIGEMANGEMKTLFKECKIVECLGNQSIRYQSCDPTPLRRDIPSNCILLSGNRWSRHPKCCKTVKCTSVIPDW